MSESKRAFLIFPLLVLAQFLFVLFYLGQERCVHFWDYAMYANMAIRWFDSGGTPAFWPLFTQSFRESYNLLFALPSLVGFALIEPSRTVFIGSTFFFFLAHEAALGVLLRRLFGWSWGQSLVFAALGAFWIPPLWYPLLEGYPDNSAAACLTLALAFLLSEKKGWKESLGIGFLLGLSIVFRRHFAYPALALLACGGVYDLVRRQGLKSIVLFYAGAGLSCLALLALIEPSYLKEMATTDFRALYKSYERSGWFFVRFMASRMGLLLTGLALAGYAVLWRTPKARKALFVAGTFCLWLIVWAGGPSQAGDHYLVAVPTAFLLVGLAGLYEKAGRTARLIGAGVLTAQALYVFWLAPVFPLPSDEPVLSVTSTARPPWIRGDVDTLTDMARYLAQTTTNQDRIVVAGSSFILNADIVRAVYTDILKDYAPAYRYLPTPEIDGKQLPPFDAYAAATVYVVPNPPQYHLPPEGQKIVTALAAQFPPPQTLSAFFERDPRHFKLDRDVTVSIWRRKAWTPAALHTGLGFVRAIADAPLSWVGMETGAGLTLAPTSPEETVAEFRLSPDFPRVRLFWDKPLGRGTYRLGFGGAWGERCPAPQISLRLQKPDGSVFFEKTGGFFQNPGVLFFPVDLRHLSETEVAYATLSVETKPQTFCGVTLWQLRWEEMNAGGLPSPIRRD